MKRVQRLHQRVPANNLGRPWDRRMDKASRAIHQRNHLRHGLRHGYNEGLVSRRSARSPTVTPAEGGGCAPRAPPCFEGVPYIS
jgi:hypothetical protein